MLNVEQVIQQIDTEVALLASTREQLVAYNKMHTANASRSHSSRSRSSRNRSRSAAGGQITTQGVPAVAGAVAAPPKRKR